MLAAVERARPAPVGPGALELDVLADQLHQVRGVPDLFDDFGRDHAAMGRGGRFMV